MHQSWMILLLCWVSCLCAEDSTPYDVVAAATSLDRLIDSSLSQRHINNNPTASADVLLRRTFLCTIGRIPTLSEQNYWRAIPEAVRHVRLVKELTNSEGWIHHQYNWLADLLRVESQMMKKYRGDTYIAWLKKSIRDNTPWDILVRELLTADGRLLERGHEAVGYYLRDAGMPLDNMSNTIQAFLGTRLTCAQCHDHPFDTWTRAEYLRMAAYTNSAEVGPEKSYQNQMRSMVKKQGDGEMPKAEKQAARKLIETLTGGVRSSTKDTIKIPADYQYTDLKPGDILHAQTILGDPSPVSAGDNPRLVYAQWMTNDANPRFAQVIANRLWKRIFGVGLVEPLDNFTEDTKASHPELMTAITTLMKTVHYDLKKFQQVLLLTKTFSRASSNWENNGTNDYAFPGPVLRRMSAEQVWDSLITLIIPDPDHRRLADAEPLYAWYESMRSKTPAELIDTIHELGKGIDERNKLQQDIKKLEPDRDANKRDIAALRKQIKQIRDRLQNGGHEAPPGESSNNRMEPWSAYRPQLVRSSELPQPAPMGHVLRDFGQSDRLLIDNSSDINSVPQALIIMNGIIDQDILRPNSALMSAIGTTRTPDERLSCIFMAVLSRLPNDQERQRLRSIAATESGLKNIVWSLLNSHEFMYQN